MGIYIHNLEETLSFTKNSKVDTVSNLEGINMGEIHTYLGNLDDGTPVVVDHGIEEDGETFAIIIDVNDGDQEFIKEYLTPEECEEELTFVINSLSGLSSITELIDTAHEIGFDDN